MDPIKVDLTGEKATLLITLYGKAMESRSDRSILHDRLADEVVGRIDYDFDSLRLRPDDRVGLAMRAKIFDDWARDFLAANPKAVILNLACGLDTRVFRVDPGHDVPWFDVDYPEVIELRRKLLPSRPGYTMIGASVTGPDWLGPVPADRPALIIAEGLTPYLAKADGIDLLRRLTRHFRSGDIVFDGYSRLGLRLIQSNAVVRSTGAKLHWAIEDPEELETLVPGLKFVSATSTYDAAHAAYYSWAAQMLLMLWRAFPPLRRIGRLLRYRF